MRDPDLADGIARLAEDGAAPFYTGDIGTAVSEWVIERGGTLTRADLAAYATIPRDPVHVRYHGREVLTNPPPSAGGLLIAYALALLERGDGPPDAAALVAAMEAAQAERTPDFLEHLARTGLPASSSWARGSAPRPTSACSTPTAGRARSRRPTARARGSWCPAPASTSTT